MKGGNLMKFGENFKQATSAYCASMFYGCSGLVSAENLIIPRNTENNAYRYLFFGCTSLEKAPALHVTTLVNRCYFEMFYGCTSLVTAPELPATTLTPYCYTRMFYGCINLAYVKCLATNISATSCLYYWMSGVRSTGTFVKASGMEGWTRGVSGIPYGWTIEEE